jgi:SAM-dependent methyltransferase
MSFQPVNYKKRTDQELDAAVTYALDGSLKTLLELFHRLKLSPEGLHILELGPGTDFGAQLILASLGAHVTLADRFLTKMDPDYHVELYTEIARRWNGPKTQLEIAIREGHEATSLRLLEEPAEALCSIPNGSVDVVYSNAVLEHIADIQLVAQELARITRRGGWGKHQIDMRDHRQFDQPLEHLIMDEKSFREKAEAYAFEFGNRLRSIEFWAHFEAAGFLVQERDTNAEPEPGYLRALLPRLRTCRSEYRNWPETDLRRTGGSFYLQQQSHADEALAKSRGLDLLSLISALKAPGQIESKEIFLSPSSIIHESGHCWIAPVPEMPPGDTVEHRYGSGLRFFENGVILRPIGAQHAHIRSKGGGAYSHWGTNLYFSTSDNTSPVLNGRRYSIQMDQRENS